MICRLESLGLPSLYRQLFRAAKERSDLEISFIGKEFGNSRIDEPLFFLFLLRLHMPIF